MTDIKDKSMDKLQEKKQVTWLKNKKIVVPLVIGWVTMAVSAGIIATRDNAFEVLIEDKVVGIVETEEQVVTVVTDYLEQKQEEGYRDPILNEEIKIKPVNSKKEEWLTPEALMEVIEKELTYEQKAIKLIINQKEAVIVENKEVAHHILKDVVKGQMTEEVEVSLHIGETTTEMPVPQEEVSEEEESQEEQSEQQEETTDTEDNQTPQEDASSEESGAPQEGGSTQENGTAQGSGSSQQNGTAQESGTAKEDGATQESGSSQASGIAQESEAVKENRTAQEGDSSQASEIAQESEATKENQTVQEGESRQESTAAQTGETSQEGTPTQQDESAQKIETTSENGTTEESASAQDKDATTQTEATPEADANEAEDSNKEATTDEALKDATSLESNEEATSEEDSLAPEEDSLTSEEEDTQTNTWGILPYPISEDGTRMIYSQASEKKTSLFNTVNIGNVTVGGEAYTLESSGNVQRQIKAFDFYQDVVMEECYVEEQQILSEEDAFNVLISNTDEIMYYEMQEGDNIWDLAILNETTMDRILEINPQITDVSRMQIGEVIKLEAPDPVLSTVVTQQTTFKELIPSDIEYVEFSDLYKDETKVYQEGHDGIKEIMVLVEQVNGKEVGRELLAESVIKEAKTKVIAYGTQEKPKPQPQPKPQNNTSSSGSSSSSGNSSSSGSSSNSGSAGGSATNVPSKMFMNPLNGAGRISSQYGTRWGSFHRGIDIAAPQGTPIYASASGTVTYSAYNRGGFGNLIIIDHGNGYETYYAHNHKNYVKVGQYVNKGQNIGAVGSTGDSTGNHIHFEIRKNGSPINPYSYIY